MKCKLLTLILSMFVSWSGYADSGLRIAVFSKDPHSLSPFYAAGTEGFLVVSALYDSLMFLDENGQLQFGLADNYEQLSPTTYRLSIRRGVRFHNGEELTAESVKATFDMHLAPQVKSSRRYIFASIERIGIQDKYHVIFQTKYPDNMFLYRLVLFSGIVPASLIRTYGPQHLDQIHVGAGPFIFDSWTHGQLIRLRRNPAYWRPGLPKAAHLSFPILPKERWKTALIDDEIDIIPDFPGKEARLFAPNPNISIRKRLTTATYWFLLNNHSPQLANPLVRKAINVSVNREDLIQYAAYGNGMVFQSIDFAREEQKQQPYLYNPGHGRQLLTEAGYPDGLTLHGWVTENSETVAKIIKKQLQTIKITLDYEVLSGAEHAKRLQLVKAQNGTIPKNVDFVMNLVGNPIGHPGFPILCFLHSDGIQSITSDPHLDQQFTALISANNEDTRNTTLQEINRYLIEQSLFIPTYRVKQVLLSRKGVVTEIPVGGIFAGEFVARMYRQGSSL